MKNILETSFFDASKFNEDQNVRIELMNHSRGLLSSPPGMKETNKQRLIFNDHVDMLDVEILSLTTLLKGDGSNDVRLQRIITQIGWFYYFKPNINTANYY